MPTVDTLHNQAVVDARRRQAARIAQIAIVVAGYHIDDNASVRECRKARGKLSRKPILNTAVYEITQNNETCRPCVIDQGLQALEILRRVAVWQR